MFKVLLRNQSILSCVCFVVISLLFAVQIDAASFAKQIIPIGCLLIMLLAALAELVSARREASQARVYMTWSFAPGRGLLLFAAYLGAIYLIGFLAATPLFVGSVFWMLRPGCKNLLMGLMLGCVLSGLTYVLFVMGMGNLLPEGILLGG